MATAASQTPSEAADVFVAELKHWRDVRGLSQSALAKQVDYTPSYISKVEHGQQRPSSTFARQADAVLRAGGALRRAHREFERQVRDTPAAHDHVEPDSLRHVDDEPRSLVVEHDDAELRFDRRMFHAIQRRQLRNDSSEPITRYLIRISVDRYPGNPERSNQLYRTHPLTWNELNLRAGCNGEPMLWKVKHDHDAFKEVWLLFENESGHFPLYPGETTWIEYDYTVSKEKWGPWFQRTVRLPTRRLSVRLVFPANTDPVVWGMETTMTAEALPFHTAISQDLDDGKIVFSWATDHPPLHARYRLEWKLRGHDEEPMTATPSETMRSLGIVQDGDPILTNPARLFDLPSEAEDARRVVAELHSAMRRVTAVHVFTKGTGIAAPQIGIDRAAAIVRTPDGEMFTLLNPKIVEESSGTDEQYEGCLSFFDVRGLVPRSLTLEVEHQEINGQRRITVFQRGIARLVAHEIDHLNGILYTARMRPGVQPIPISEYQGTGERWKY